MPVTQPNREEISRSSLQNFWGGYFPGFRNVPALGTLRRAKGLRHSFVAVWKDLELPDCRDRIVRHGHGAASRDPDRGWACRGPSCQGTRPRRRGAAGEDPLHLVDPAPKPARAPGVTVVGPICCAPEFETGLAGWAYRIRTAESGRGLPDWICVTTWPEIGASPAAETLRVRAA